MPRYQQIARQLKTAIERGELQPGARLPSSRTWSQELGISRSTVENAYVELVAQGWLERRGQAGTFVSAQLHPEQTYSEPVVFAGESTVPQPFQMGLPALDLFPRDIWARVMGRRLRTQTRFDLALGDVCGEAVLRQAIVDYLRVSRSIDCLPEQIFITSGYAASMTLILRALAKPGDGMWIEDPGFPLIRPVPIDDDGLNVAIGIRDYPDARFALLTPAHQSPLGVALSLARRHQLLEWASHTQAWIIEDDYDSEFRYHGKPLPPLKSLDAPQRVIYAGTFSKSLFPALRQHYAQRRQWTERALGEQGFHVVPQQGGIQLVITVDGDDIAPVRKANEAGLAVQALSRWRLNTSGMGGILLSFTNIASPEIARQVAKRLRQAIQSAL